MSVLVVTVSMTAWMLFRGMPHRAIAEMTAVVPLLAAVVVALGWSGLWRRPTSRFLSTRY